MRTLRPTPEIYAFYDGRVEGYSFGDAPNWVDEGALSLGIASHAIVDGDEALIYDTHIDHARHVRRTLELLYIDSLLREPQPRDSELRELMAQPLEAGWITYFAPYEAIHRHNLQLVAAARRG